MPRRPRLPKLPPLGVERLESRTVPALVAAYGFEEAAGTSVTDSSGANNSGTLSGPTRVAGKYGQGLSFDGINDMVTVADSNSLDLTTGMTVMAWVRPIAITDYKTVILKERSGGLAYALYGGSPNNGPASAYITRNGTSSDIGAEGGPSLPLNSWSHLVAPGRDLRRHDHPALRQRQSNRHSGCRRRNHHLDEPAANRRQ